MELQVGVQKKESRPQSPGCNGWAFSELVGIAMPVVQCPAVHVLPFMEGDASEGRAWMSGCGPAATVGRVPWWLAEEGTFAVARRRSPVTLWGATSAAVLSTALGCGRRGECGWLRRQQVGCVSGGEKGKRKLAGAGCHCGGRWILKRGCQGGEVRASLLAGCRDVVVVGGEVREWWGEEGECRYVGCSNWCREG
jgi:hypothetical protein